MIRIVIADDHPIFLKGLEEILLSKDNFEIVGKAFNGIELLEQIRIKKPNVVITDINMPLLNGLESCKTILSEFPETKVLILSMYKKKPYLDSALKIGVLGYVLKDNAVNDIIQAIESVIINKVYISPSFEGYFISNKENKTIDHYIDKLTLTEKKILSLIGEYKTSKEIAETLFIAEKTVSNHRMNILKKLDISGKNNLVKFAVENYDKISY